MKTMKILFATILLLQTTYSFAQKTMKKQILFLLFLFSTSFVFSQTAEPETSPCPNPKKLRAMCGMVGDWTKDFEPQGKYEYLYQRRFLEAACVDLEKDSKEEISKKISQVWIENEDKFICNNTQFDVGNGNIIKFAVVKNFDTFIFDIIDWKVNLNKVDETDGRTVLDYVKYQMEKAKGTSLEKKLKFYYSSLKSAGAKHKSEL